MLKFCNASNYLVVFASIVLYISKIVFVVQESSACMADDSKVVLTVFYILVVILCGYLAFSCLDIFRGQKKRIGLKSLMKTAYDNNDYNKACEAMDAHPVQFDTEPLFGFEQPLFHSLFQFSAIDNSRYQEDRCILCLEEFSQETDLQFLELGCKHVFHEKCTIAWFERKFTCPMCKAPQRIFLVEKFFERDGLLK
jgi:hypothetical protein